MLSSSFVFGQNAPIDFESAGKGANWTWACFENGPIKPVKINGRLAWLVSDIRDVIKGGSDV